MPHRTCYPVTMHTLVLLALVLLTLSPVSTQAARLTLAESFEEIALKNEYGPNGWMPVRKWENPIRIFHDSRVGDRPLQHKLVLQHITRLQEITGHSITLVETPEQANLYLLFERESRVRLALRELAPGQQFSRQFINRSVCFGTIQMGKNQRIEQALVVIPVDRARYAGKFNSCVVEELTQVMGLVNDSVRVFPSIFNDKSIDQELSRIDIQLLKLLYHPNIKAGMERDEVMPEIHRIIEQATDG